MSGINPPVMTATGGPDSHAIKKLKLADLDGDSTMHSSGELAPQTPRNAAQALSSELSPPNSQGPPSLPRDDSINAALAEDNSLNANGKRALAPATAAAASTAGPSGQAPAYEDPETGYRWSSQEDQPGYAWLNNRAREEASRAIENIVDRNYMIRSMYHGA
jgi:hypothetical protein